MTDGLSEAYEAKMWDVFCENNDLLLENDQLKAENAKLRELCGELYHELYAARDEYWPASYLGDLEPRDVFPRYDELIELGVDA